MSNEVMKKDTGSLALFGDDAAKGFENMTQDDMALPFVRILGQLSPQVTDGDAKYMHGVVYNLASTLQKNDKGSWYGWVVTQDRILGQADKALYLSAKDFSGNVSKGTVQTKADVEEKVKDSTPY
jgi:hypothetical protein